MWQANCCPFEQQTSLDIAGHIASQLMDETWAGFEVDPA
jgi:hypothetical protein